MQRFCGGDDSSGSSDVDSREDEGETKVAGGQPVLTPSSDLSGVDSRDDDEGENSEGDEQPTIAV
jgi:hypothetical protein